MVTLLVTRAWTDEIGPFITRLSCDSVLSFPGKTNIMVKPSINHAKLAGAISLPKLHPDNLMLVICRQT